MRILFLWLVAMIVSTTAVFARPGSPPAAFASRASQEIENAKAIADCVSMWEAKTHMTKMDWLRTCRRVQQRFQQLDMAPRQKSAPR